MDIPEVTQNNPPEVGEGHRHVWKPPARTHGGWYVACEDEACGAWWASPGPDAPTEVPAWMQATAGPSVVGTPMRVLGQKVADGVIYPSNVPSNTIDATPPKASSSDERGAPNPHLSN